MNGNPITDCEGFFLDSGGGNGDYGPNENFTTTICSDGSDGTHIQLFFSGLELADGDELCFYDGLDTSGDPLSCSDDFLGGQSFIVQATAVNTSGCLTVTFTSDGTGEGVGWSAAIDCVAACQTIQAELISSDPAVFPADTGYIDACVGQRILFSGAGQYPQNGAVYDHSDFTSEFQWDFGDGTLAVGPDVSHEYEEPGGYTVELTITDQFGCRSTNFISQRVRIAPPPIFEVGGDLPPQICSGDTVELNAIANILNEAYTLSVYPDTSSFQAGGIISDSLPLPDGTGAVYETSISISQFSPGQVLENISDLVSICVNMEHSWMHDLDLFISCPDGTQVQLQDQDFIPNEVFLGEPYELDDNNTPTPPGQGVGYEYCWTPQATQTWTEYSEAFDPDILPEGDYASDGELSDLVGCPLNGDWTLIVQDQWASDNGWVFEWSINFRDEIFPNLETFHTGIASYEWGMNPNNFYQTTDSIASTPQNAGTANFTLSVVDSFGCAYDTSLNLVVLPETHPDCFDCAELIVPQDDVILCEGEDISFDVSNSDIVLDQVIAFDAFPFHPIGFSNYPPGSPYAAEMSVNSINPTVLTDPLSQIVSICLDIETDWASDLDIYLRAPSGELLELSTRNGGALDNYTNTCFTPDAILPITTGTPPFTGDFQPEGNWLDLQNADVNGTWTLEITDAFGVNELGRLNSWSITFNSTNEITYTWTPSSGVSCPTCPDVTISPTTTTPYYVEAQDAYGCVFGDSITVGTVSDLVAPEVVCETLDDNVIVFNWNQVGSFTEYEINVTTNGTSAGWQGPITDLSYVADNLDINDEITLQVRIWTNAIPLDCEIPVGEATCINDACILQGAALEILPASCFGDQDGSVEVQATDFLAPVTFALDGSTSTQSTGEFGGLAGGDHFVVVQDATTCFDTVFFTVPQPDSFAVSLNIDQPVSCFEGSDGQLTAIPSGGNGGYQFSWPNQPGVTADNLSALSAGSYTVNVIDEKGCTATATLELTQPTALQLTLSSTNTSCADAEDGTVSAIAEGGTGLFTYTWSNGGPDASTQQDLPAGNYCVTITDENGCTESGCVDILAPDPLVIDSLLITSVDCNGNSTGAAGVIISGGAGDYAYQWNDDLQQVAAQAVFLPAGEYQVVVTDQNNCQLTTTVTVPEPDPLTVSATATDVACNGDADGTITANPLGGTSPYTYAWQDQQTQATAVDLTAATYGVTVTDINGCTAETTAQVNQPAEAVNVDATQTYMGCFGMADNEASAVATGGSNTGFTYQWSDALNQNGATAIDLDSVTYVVTATDSQGCTAIDTLLLTDLEPIDFIIIANPPTCFGDTDGELGVTQVTGGIGAGIEPNYDYSWSNQQNGIAIQNLAGDVTYIVTVTDAQGCSTVRERLLPEPIQIMFDIEAERPNCFGEENGSATVVNIQGDNQNFAFQWDNAANNQVTETAAGLSAGTYSVTLTDDDGCTNFNSVTIDQPTELAIDVQVKDNPCFGDELGSISTLVSGGIPGYSYKWSNNAAGSELDGLGAGTYNLTVTDNNGCERATAIEVTQPASLDAQVQTEDVRCFGDRNGRINITMGGGTAPFQYSLDNSTFTGSSTLIGLEVDDYNVFIVDANGCTTTESVSLGGPDEFLVDAGEDITITLGQSTTLLASSVNGFGEVEYVWSAPYDSTMSCMECINPTVFPSYTIDYELYGIDTNGCESTDLIRVNVSKPRLALVPTGFTPNGDGMNDLLLVHGNDSTKVMRFQIFDRWGEMVYEKGDFMVNDPSVGWDGTFRGEPMNGGVYIWYLEVEYPFDQATETFRGQTTLIR